jgi:membrane-associated phospholipid phosphatase
MPGVLEWTTGLGDAALLLPASLLLLLYFTYRGSVANAFTWATSLVICASLTIALKLCFHACGAALPFLDIRSPSGHASFSTTFYLSAGIVASAERQLWLRASSLFLGAGLSVAIAVSRVALQVHTPAEAALGCVIGLGCAAWFAAGYRRNGPTLIDWRALAGIVVALALATHGWHLSAETTIAAVARLLNANLPACVEAT